jgi:hypothetical protein
MKLGFCLLPALMLAGCALGPVSPGQRAAAAQDVPENHPHPPALVLHIPGDDGMEPLRCYNNGQDTVCSRGSN